MTQEGFAALCDQLSLEEMSFEAIYLTFLLGGLQTGPVEDVMCVCPSRMMMQRTLDALGCRTLGDVPSRLATKCTHMQRDYDEQTFRPFFRWLFEMGKAIAALNHGSQASAVRTVPLSEGLQLIEAVLGKWAFMPDLKAFCTDRYAQPFTKDLWTQISRFVHMTQVGRIKADLSNYDDDDSGGGSAWPSAIDDFVEYVQEIRGA